MEKSKQKLLRPKEVAEILGIGESTLWVWVQKGILPPPQKLSPRVTVFKKADIDRMVETGSWREGGE